jgi:serine/threonine-protein kinase RsbW
MALNKKQIKISSSTLQLDQVESFIQKMFTELNIKKELFYKVLICVNEAVVNSIQHGNKFDENKKVIIQSFSCKQYLYFRIIDEGEGFNFNELCDPTTIDNIYNETGRGIFIIKNITDEIAFREKGNIIEFKIKLDGKN